LGRQADDYTEKDSGFADLLVCHRELHFWEAMATT